MKVSKDEKKNQIELSLIEVVGDKIGKKLLAYFGSAKAILLSSKSDLEKADGIGKVLVNSIINANEWLQVEFKGLIISLPGKIYKKNI